MAAVVGSLLLTSTGCKKDEAPEGDGAAATASSGVEPSDRGQVAAGGELLFAVGSDGKLYAWGLFAHPEEITVDEPALTKDAEVRKLYAEGRQLCVLYDSGQLLCNGEKTDVLKLATPKKVVDYGAAGGDNCALFDDGTVSCRSRGDFAPVPGLAKAVDLQVEGGTSCAIDEAGEVWCFGIQGPGEASKVDGFGPATTFAKGDHEICVLVRDGTMRCWDPSPNPSLFGDEDEADNAPRTIEGVRNAVEAGMFAGVIAVLTAEGEVLGATIDDGQPEGALKPFAGLPKIVDLDVGDLNACMKAEDGSIFAYGLGAYREANTPLVVEKPTKLPGVSDVLDVVLTEVSTCTLRSDGSVWCNGAGKALPSGASGGQQWRVAQQKLESRTDVVSIAAAKDTVCVAAKGKPLDCWSPSRGLSGGRAVDRVWAGGYETICARASDGVVYCDDWDGGCVEQLEDEDPQFATTQRLQVEGIEELAIAGAKCAIVSGGAVRCWGVPGLPSETDANDCTSALVPGLKEVRAVAVGREHGCAITKDGRVVCFGDGGRGIPYAEELPPTNVVEGIADAVSLEATGEGTCAVHATGEVSCWGSVGSLRVDGPKATKVPGLSDVTRLALGMSHGCAVHRDGTVSCWGYNRYGQVGIGGETESRVQAPVAIANLPP